MKRATRATLEAWGGSALVVIAAVMMKVSSFSPLRTIAFVAVVVVATGLIISSFGSGRGDDE